MSTEWGVWRSAPVLYLHKRDSMNMTQAEASKAEAEAAAADNAPHACSCWPPPVSLLVYPDH
jgi:hypothetical protein